MEKNYDYLIGKTKKEVINELGDGFNFYPDNEWTYIFRQDFFFRKEILYVFFNNNIVFETKCRKTYRIHHFPIGVQ